MAIVCHCHAVSDRTLRSLAARCGGSLAEVQRHCQAATNCGGCHDTVEEIVESAISVRPLGDPLAVAAVAFA